MDRTVKQATLGGLSNGQFWPIVAGVMVSAHALRQVDRPPQPRTEVTKLLWDYIKLNNLQNPANKRNILCDAKLQAVMGKPEVTMFEMSGLVGKHLS